MVMALQIEGHMKNKYFAVVMMLNEYYFKRNKYSGLLRKMTKGK